MNLILKLMVGIKRGKQKVVEEEKIERRTTKCPHCGENLRMGGFVQITRGVVEHANASMQLRVTKVEFYHEECYDEKEN